MLSPNVVPDFTKLRVAVVGDLVADHYLYAQPTRLSREAPVMVMRFERDQVGAGGAGNVARNLWALGAEVVLVGAVGRDANGREVLRILEQDQVDVSRVASVAGWETPTKTRILGAEPGRTPHQVLRIDREPEAGVGEEVRARLAGQLRELVGSVDAVLISDYGYGVVGEQVAELGREFRAAGATVALDPRCNIELFHGLTAITPNLSELGAAVGVPAGQLTGYADITAAAHHLLKRLQPEWLLVTLGNRGMALYSSGLPHGARIEPSDSDEVIDVSGAGDTAAATFTLSLAAGLEGPRAMRLANAASGVVVMETRTAVCALSKLRSALPQAPRPVLVEEPVKGPAPG